MAKHHYSLTCRTRAPHGDAPHPPGAQQGTNDARAGPLAVREIEAVLREEPAPVQGTNRDNRSHETCHKIKSHESTLTGINRCIKEQGGEEKERRLPPERPLPNAGGLNAAPAEGGKETV